MNTHDSDSDPWLLPNNPPSEICLKEPEDVDVPGLEEIPEKFENQDHWMHFQTTWFEDGIEQIQTMIPKNGIDSAVAFAHLSAIQSSFTIDCEHKRRAVAWLASRWFENWVCAGDADKQLAHAH